MIVKKLFPYFKRAYAGKRTWKRIKRKYHVDKATQVVIMPETDRELNKTAYRYMGNMMNRRSAKKALVICPAAGSGDMAPRKYEVAHCVLPMQKIENILHYYELHIFTKNISVISYDKPNGNTMYKFVGQNGITPTDAVCLGMYCLREMPEGGDAL